MQRQIAGTLDVRFVDRIQQDILEHRNDAEYDILYLTPVSDSNHDFRVRIEDFPSLDLENFDQWSQSFRTAYAHINQRHPLGVPFIVSEVCKSGCDDEDCHNGLGDGGAGLQLLALDADGMLVFYDAADCPDGQEVDTFSPNDEQTGTDCKPLRGNPVSFRFIKV
ncbi:hypothetical protein N7450_011796 [Penicillium hetheringtonii]|uniref:Uncharacterized protein n=1 Tax=Penicillium hetheringtonii TaxID=911720 RepID=A0AAD6DBJ7_9EURO|nr:hypothetical protein N7450_011796 [Penicillium hetheringtonii]